MQPPEWKGQHSQRFSGGRRHISPEGELNTFFQSNLAPHPLGIRTFAQKLSDEHEFRPSLKTYEENYHSNQKEIDLRGLKYLTLPEQAERRRKQRGHVIGGLPTNYELQPKGMLYCILGIKTYSASNQSRGDHYYLQSQMQAKLRVLGLEGQRNGVGVSSLGDKSYKYPEYESNFYKAGGLIAGATGFRLRSGDNSLPDPSKLKSIFTKPMWSQKVKLQEQQEQKNAIGSVDEWQRTILKEANPKWNDPDTFFQRMQKVGNVGGKQVKKGAKK